MALTDNLVAFWRLEEASGTRNDSFGTNHLTDVNTVGSATGKVGTGASFVAASSECLNSSAAVLDLGTDTSFTIACWVNFTNIGVDRALFGRFNPPAPFGYLVYYSPAHGRFRLTFTDAASATASVLADSFGVPSTGVWYFVVAWHDAAADTVNIQVNNGPVDSAAWSTGTSPSTGPATIGAYYGAATGFMDGLIDEVGFWTRALTATERTQLYNSGAGERFTWLTLAAYWKMDETSGTRNDSFGTNHLTDINTVGTATAKLGTYAAQFVAASGERLAIADNTAFSMGGTALTISAWIYLDTTGASSKAIVSKHDGVSIAGTEYMLYYGGGTLNFIVYGGGTAGTASGPAVSVATWYFIVVWYDPAGPTINIQVNNGTVVSAGIGFTPNDATAAFNVSGISNGTDPMDGRIDEVGIWRRVLTAGERTDLYNGGAGITYSAQSQAPRSMHQRRLRAVV